MAVAPTKPTLLADILARPDETIRAYQRGGISSAVLRELAAEAEHPELRRFLASYPETPARLLEQLAAGDEPEMVREALAGHARAPRAVLMQLAGDASPRVRQAVAGNRALTPQVALLLAEDASVAVRLALAANPAIPPRTQAQLAQDPHPLVRSTLLGQSRLDAETQRQLAETADPLARVEAIAGAEATDHALLAWADSDQEIAQTALLLRRSLPDKVLESLCFSTHPDIQRQALERHRLSTDELLGWSQSEQPAVRILMAGRPGLPPAIQRLLGEDPAADVRQALAGNPELDETVALLLAGDADPAVQTALALNPNLAAAALAALCASSSRIVRKLAAARPDLAAEHIALLLEDGDEEVVYHLAGNEAAGNAPPPGPAGKWVRHRLPTLRTLPARCPEHAHKLVHDPAPGVARIARAALASRPRPTERTEPETETAPAESKGFLKRLLGRIVGE